jgi:uncharacterized protein YhaN
LITSHDIQANLEKQIKELNVRIVDLETKSYSPRPATISRRSESRVEELASQLHQDKITNRSVARDAKFQSAELDRQRARIEEERKSYESQILALRQEMDVMVNLFCLHCLSLVNFCFSKRKGATFERPGGEQNVKPPTTSRKY